MTKHFSGLYTAIITPFLDTGIDNERLGRIVEEQISADVDGIVALGSTGEPATLSPEEHISALAQVIEVVKARTAVIAGTGSNSTAEAIRYSTEAQQLGANALLIIAPYYNKPTQPGLLAHFTAIADRVSIPIIMYNIPGRTGVNMEPDTVIKLSRHPNIAGLKEASSNFNNIERIIKETDSDFSVLCGNDEETLRVIQCGGDGVIAVASNVIPKEMKQYVDACLLQDWSRAAQLHCQLLPLFKALSLETNPIPIKTLMAHTHRCQEIFRLPLTPIHPDNRRQLLEAWAAFTARPQHYAA